MIYFCLLSVDGRRCIYENSGDMAEGKNYIGSFCTVVSENKNSMTVSKNLLQANLYRVGINAFNGIFAIRFYCNGDYCMKERVITGFITASFIESWSKKVFRLQIITTILMEQYRHYCFFRTKH